MMDAPVSTPTSTLKPPVSPHSGHSGGWRFEEIQALFDLPFMELLYQAQTVHRQHFDPNRIQLSSLLSVKTGGCAEDCKYCPQSSHYEVTHSESMMDVEAVVEAARCARQHGASRFCMGAAWREPKGKAFDRFLQMISAVKAEGMETCVTLGMLTEEQTAALKEAGLDYYNHNLDTAPDYYDKIITTRTYQDRLDTLSRVRKAGIKVCCGGIVGMG
ncbi:MAG: biotin synthase BioB, partial [Gammaproteobacteria bacterium]